MSDIPPKASYTEETSSDNLMRMFHYRTNSSNQNKVNISESPLENTKENVDEEENSEYLCVEEQMEEYNGNTKGQEAKEIPIIPIIINDEKPKECYKEGRWSPEEHCKFLEGLIKYGNNWKKVQKHIVTRSSTQARSHAQKFFMSCKKKIAANCQKQEASQIIKELFSKDSSIKMDDEKAERIEKLIKSSVMMNVDGCTDMNGASKDMISSDKQINIFGMKHYKTMKKMQHKDNNNSSTKIFNIEKNLKKLCMKKQRKESMAISNFSGATGYNSYGSNVSSPNASTPSYQGNIPPLQNIQASMSSFQTQNGLQGKNPKTTINIISINVVNNNNNISNNYINPNPINLQRNGSMNTTISSINIYDINGMDKNRFAAPIEPQKEENEFCNNFEENEQVNPFCLEFDHFIHNDLNDKLEGSYVEDDDISYNFNY